MRGFSLIELLIAMTIAGVLAAIALPGYSHTIQRALRQDARLALLRVQYRQEEFFSDHLRYASQLRRDDPAGLDVSERSDGGHYRLELQTAADGMSYTAIARIDPSGRQASDTQCAQLAIDESGQRSSANASNRRRQDDPNRCWG